MALPGSKKKLSHSGIFDSRSVRGARYRSGGCRLILGNVMHRDPMALTAHHLRERAARYRQDADDEALPQGVIEELHALAADYDDDAERLESWAGDDDEDYSRSVVE